LDTAANGNGALRYSWDFGDGSTATGATPTHAYRRAGWYLTKLAVLAADGRTSGYEQLVKVGQPTSARPSSNACGLVSAADVSSLLKGFDSGGASASGAARGGVQLARTGMSPVLPAGGCALLVIAGATLARRRWSPLR
ncbi:MAG TPA: PKD domain-containing protein, partial [Mycobacteriales bacterium]|nr:PKD domain-containing protein [Mycobacteriales bacterium]